MFTHTILNIYSGVTAVRQAMTTPLINFRAITFKKIIANSQEPITAFFLARLGSSLGKKLDSQYMYKFDTLDNRCLNYSVGRVNIDCSLLVTRNVHRTL